MNNNDKNTQNISETTFKLDTDDIGDQMVNKKSIEPYKNNENLINDSDVEFSFCKKDAINVIPSNQFINNTVAVNQFNSKPATALKTSFNNIDYNNFNNININRPSVSPLKSNNILVSNFDINNINIRPYNHNIRDNNNYHSNDTSLIKTKPSVSPGREIRYSHTPTISGLDNKNSNISRENTNSNNANNNTLNRMQTISGNTNIQRDMQNMNINNRTRDLSSDVKRNTNNRDISPGINRLSNHTVIFHNNNNTMPNNNNNINKINRDLSPNNNLKNLNNNTLVNKNTNTNTNNNNNNNMNNVNSANMFNNNTHVPNNNANNNNMNNNNVKNNSNSSNNNLNNQNKISSFNNNTVIKSNLISSNSNNPNNTNNNNTNNNTNNKPSNTNHGCNNNNNNNNNQKKELMSILYEANQLYKKGVKLSQEFDYIEALSTFQDAKIKTQKVYDQLKHDPTVKKQMDHFINALDCQLFNMENLKKQQFAYKPYQQNNNFNQALAEDIRRAFDKNKKEDASHYYNINKQKSPNTKNSKSSTQQVTKNNDNKDIKIDSNSSNKSKSSVPDELRERIISEIVETKLDTKFEDIIGQEQAKQSIKEIIILPSLRPDLFTGLRSPPRGLLLFGPPGTGKTMLAKAVATECKCTFFNISASSLTSKFVGESEKLVRLLFDLAFEREPSVVFIDEIDSILSKRNESENEASKRLKTEFLIQFDGVGSNNKAKVLIIGATNRPMELDSAVVRRLPKRIYVGAFNKEERFTFLKFIMKKQENNISDDEFLDIANKTECYSNSDLKELCREAAYGPIRDVDMSKLIDVDKLRPVCYGDFLHALKKVRGILNDEILKSLEDWDKSYGAVN